MTYGIVKDGVVINAIEYDGVSPYALEDGEKLVLLKDDAWIDWEYRGGVFSPPDS